ncbi:hypothetical protein KBY28_18780 [Ruegeria pomeroyi]|nr:hypothetical protein [Ruegeria pomeroyi]
MTRTRGSQHEMSTNLFYAELANYLGVGDLRSDDPDGGWSWNRHSLTLGRYRVALTQDRQIVAQRPRGGGLIPSTQLVISGVRSFAEGERVTDDLSRLLSLAAQSQVVPLSYRFGGYGRQPLHPMGQALYFRPLLPIRDGAVMRTYLETVWPRYRLLRRRRKLAEVIDMLLIAELPVQPLEVKLAQLFIVMENLKSTHAKACGYPFRRGRYRDPAQPSRVLGFEALLRDMFAEMGMRPGLRRLVTLRNEIVHFGLSRRPYESLRDHHDRGKDILHEYLLRLLGFRGRMLLYRHAARVGKDIG